MKMIEHYLKHYEGSIDGMKTRKILDSVQLHFVPMANPDALTSRLKYETKLCAQINYHAMGQIIFGDYSGKSKTMRKRIYKMYKIAQEETEYDDSSGYSAPSNGNYREYVMYRMNVPSITIEVGTTNCPVSYYEYDRIFSKNKNVVLKIANQYK